SRTLWLSATLNKSWLKTVDFAEYLDNARTLTISDEDKRLAGTRLNAPKTLKPGTARLDTETKQGNGKMYLETLAAEILAAHQPGTNTLAILNSVERAQNLMRQLQRRKAAAELILVHARFRASERKALNRAIQREAPAEGRMIVATQAIEAGVDISSQTLFTELASWSSLVQRFGRCNRYGEYAQAMIYWLDVADEASAPPYPCADMEQARNTLRGMQNASLSELPAVTAEQPISHTLRRKDFLDLFNTDPDLTGFDIDISLYIRDEGAPQLFVFWRDFDGLRPEESQPERAELCPVSITQVKDHLKKDKDIKAFTWDSLAGMWKAVAQNNVHPGQTLLLRAKDGGYDQNLGFVASDKHKVDVLPHENANDQIYQKDPDSIKSIPILLADHLSHVQGASKLLLSGTGCLPDSLAEAIVTAALWHDVGKAHQVFQTTLKKAWPEGDAKHLQLWAKSPSSARHSRPYFRHELASMLAWLEHGEKTPTHDLIAYLILAHHGKVRMSLRAMPDEKAPNGKRYARGIYEADILPPVNINGNVLPETTLRLDVMELGESEMGPSWTHRTQKLLAEHGPFLLAWYESLVRIADWRASDKEQRP
ncbi:MAG: CRISPR-associated helicase Cas3', partial [Methylococcales bacterium]